MKNKIVEYFLAPAMVAIIVIFVQFFIQPEVQKKATIKTELWLEKKRIYVETVKMIDKRFDSMFFDSAEPIVNTPTTQEINKVFRELLLMCDNDEIIIKFQSFMDYSVEDYCSPASRGDFINLIREDLGKDKFSIKPEVIPYFRMH